MRPLKNAPAWIVAVLPTAIRGRRDRQVRGAAFGDAQIEAAVRRGVVHRTGALERRRVDAAEVCHRRVGVDELAGEPQLIAAGTVVDIDSRRRVDGAAAVIAARAGEKEHDREGSHRANATANQAARSVRTATSACVPSPNRRVIPENPMPGVT
jgi:hypothetical protein